MKVFIPKQKLKFDVNFYLKCPGQKEMTVKLIMTKDGTEARKREYQDVCPVTREDAEQKKNVKVAYNNANENWFQVNDDTNTMKELPLWWTLSSMVTWVS